MTRSYRATLLRFLLAGLWTIFLLFLARPAFAADISLNLSVRTYESEVVVVLENRGRNSAKDIAVSVELADKIYEATIGELGPDETKEQAIKVTPPKQPGSYPLITRTSYLNFAPAQNVVERLRRALRLSSQSEGQTLSLVEVTYYTYKERHQLSAEPGEQLMSLPKVELREWTTIEVEYDRSEGQRFRLVLPAEIEIAAQTETATGARYRLRNTRPEFKTSYRFFGVLESPDGGQKPHQAGIRRGMLVTYQAPKAHSLFSAELLAILALLSFFLSFGLYRWATREGEDKATLTQVALVRWSFTVFTVSLFFCLYRTLFVVPDWFFGHVTIQDYLQVIRFEEWLGLDRGSDPIMQSGRMARWAWRVTQAIVSRFYFEGGDFDLFTRWILDPLYIYVLLGNGFAQRYVVKPKPASDKYWHLLKSVFSLFTVLSRKRNLHWSNYSKVAVLTLLVKIFYVPLLCSWAINDIFHQQNLIVSFTWDFVVVQRFVVAGLILIDVTIFAFGYMVELPQLKNQIRSVEPTVFGWVVCLACYPPFNNFSFLPYEYALTSSWTPTGSAVWERFALALIAILWAFYTWATVALGPRSSNLTNRGIVDTGPYAYVRHPAYASKCLLWIVSAFFFNDRMFFMCIGLSMVYAARAWTEERHLSMDPDYLEYKKKVPYRCIPWVF